MKKIENRVCFSKAECIIHVKLMSKTIFYFGIRRNVSAEFSNLPVVMIFLSFRLMDLSLPAKCF